MHYGLPLGDENLVKLILENGANVNVVDDEGNTALHIVAQRGYFLYE